MASVLSRASTVPLSIVGKTGNRFFPSRNLAPILVSGSPRGGTTWVAESLAECFDSTRIFWEPLQSSNPANDHNLFGARPWVDETNVTPRQLAFFEALLAGRMANSHTVRLRADWRNAFKLLTDGKLLIKFVRGNGVVGFLKRYFNLPKPLVIVRHPCAVVASQLRMGSWNDHPHLDRHFIERRPELARLADGSLPLHSRLAVTWAGDVLAALESRDDVNIVHYETLFADGPNVLRPAFESWGCSAIPDALTSALSRHSSTTHGWAALQSRDKQLNRWAEQLTRVQVRDVLDICSEMGVEFYDSTAHPILAASAN